jgi:CRP-like cAMP-binding protein
VTDEPLETRLAEHRLFRDLSPHYLGFLGQCARPARFEARSLIFRQGTSAGHFYLIADGQVSIEIPSHEGALTIQTLGPDDVLGWSWLFPPYQWHFDARALRRTQALMLNAIRVREKCEDDPKLGYELMKRFSAIIHHRMQAARLQIMDLYGPASA